MYLDRMPIEVPWTGLSLNSVKLMTNKMILYYTLRFNTFSRYLRQKNSFPGLDSNWRFSGSPWSAWDEALRRAACRNGCLLCGVSLTHIPRSVPPTQPPSLGHVLEVSISPKRISLTTYPPLNQLTMSLWGQCPPDGRQPIGQIPRLLLSFFSRPLSLLPVHGLTLQGLVALLTLRFSAAVTRPRLSRSQTWFAPV